MKYPAKSELVTCSSQTKPITKSENNMCEHFCQCAEREERHLRCTSPAIRQSQLPILVMSTLVRWPFQTASMSVVCISTPLCHGIFMLCTRVIFIGYLTAARRAKRRSAFLACPLARIGGPGGSRTVPHARRERVLGN